MAPAHGAVRGGSRAVSECAGWDGLPWWLWARMCEQLVSWWHQGAYRVNVWLTRVSGDLLQFRSQVMHGVNQGRSHVEGWGEVLSQEAKQTNDEWVKTTLQVITRREALLRSCLQSLFVLPFLSEGIVSTMNCARSIIKYIHLGSCYICCASKQYFP